MKLHHTTSYIRIAIFLLVIANLALLFYFLKPSHAASPASPENILAWKSESYPEITQIENGSWNFQTLSQFFKDLADKKGGEYAYHALAVAANSDELPPNIDTHLLGHVVGDELYKQQGIDGIKVCTDDIRNACSHSIVVGFLLDHGASSITQAVAACHEAPGGIGAYTMCVHGLGHGVLAYEAYDMKKAVDLCGETGTAEYGDQEVGQCVGGVTMEMMAGVHDPAAWQAQVPNYFKKDDPLSPCDMGFIPGASVSYCYVYLTPHLFESAGADLNAPDPKYFSKAMSYCEALPVGDPNRQVCFGSFGKEYVVLANARNVQSITDMSEDQLKTIYDWCDSGPTEGLWPCLDSALQSLYWGGENDPAVSIRFCAAIPDKSLESQCVGSLTNAVAYYVRNDTGYKTSFCAAIPDQYQSDCRTTLHIQT